MANHFHYAFVLIARKQNCRYLAKLWQMQQKQVGIDIQIEIEAYDAIVDRQENGNFDLMLISFTMCPEGDPQYFCDLAFKTNGSR